MNGYEFEIPPYKIKFIADRLRREKHELIGELTVMCGLPGVKSVNGALSTGDFNFSSVRARKERSTLLKERATTKEQIDWFSLLEEFCQQVFAQERDGDPAEDLRNFARPAKDDEIRIDGLTFPKRHPSILFGDGGTAKSYTALYLAGRLNFLGFNVGYFDWELAGEDHRDRLERIFGDRMPEITYCRCERPLTAEADRLRRIVKEKRLDFAFYDSVAFACDGPPESAEIAGRYFRAIRSIDCGSLHIAHVTKSEEADKRPFGSTFWHNGARATWYVKAVDGDPGQPRIQLGFYCRKSNLGPLYQPTSYTITFELDTTAFERSILEDNQELAEKLSVRQRMRHLLRRGALSREEIAYEIGADIETVSREARRHRNTFIVMDGKIGLIGRAS